MCNIAEYKAAIATAESFATLQKLKPEAGELSDVFFSAGNFAVVFKMFDTHARTYKALKCFTREQPRRDESLVVISDYLKAIQSPYILPYQYLKDELWVNDADRPVLLMEWAEGETLGEKVKQLCAAHDTEGLHSLSVRFAALALWLLEQEWAHGDLKHDNIIVRPDDTLVLVDYDGCFVPSMSGQAARETGSPCFRHPQRTATDFDRHIDDFSILVIFLSLRALIEHPKWYAQKNNGENLLLTTADFEKNAALTTTLRTSNDNILRGAVALLDFALSMPNGKINSLKEGLLLPFFEENKKALIPDTIILFFNQARKRILRQYIEVKQSTENIEFEIKVKLNIEILDLSCHDFFIYN